MQEQKQPLSGVKLLVAEDDPVIAMDYAAMLSSAGAEIVGTAQTAADQQVLHKPVTADNLCTAVRAVCDRNS